jgi:toxin CcdB
MPYVLELQADLLNDLDTRVVAPLVVASVYKGAVPRLNPILIVEGVAHVLLSQQLAAIPKRVLTAERVMNVADKNYEITAAVDFLVTGI